MSDVIAELMMDNARKLGTCLYRCNEIPNRGMAT
jgi:hypothetical protein